MTSNSEIQVHSWHGDISSSKKRTVIEKGSGILQITPESLDNIVYRDYKKLYEMFHELKYIVIDEVHSFMNSERGLQLLCLIGAIERLADCHPRRVGLSATISDLAIAEKWLTASSGFPVEIIRSDSASRYDLTLRFTHIEPRGSKDRSRTLLSHYMKIYRDSQYFNCIIFANGRTAVENTVTNLKLIGNSRGENKIILAHHSSVGKEFKKYAEEMIKNPQFKCTVVATSTLELGIDVGDLDRTVQINSPNSISSFVQKMGRSGRRTGLPIMVIHTNDDGTTKLNDIKIDLIKAIAETLLLKEGWIEPIRHSLMPFSLLFQQTVTYVKSRVTSTIQELYSDVLSLYPFRMISKNDYVIFLEYLVTCNILDYNSYYATYSLASAGDRLSHHFDFRSNFITIKEMDVYHDEQLIGTIQSAQGVDGLIQLSGYAWKITSVDEKLNRFYVTPSQTNTETFWKSGTSDIHTRLMQTMYHVLTSDEIYEFLDEEAVTALKNSRDLFDQLSLKNKIVDYNGTLRLFPWLGTIQFDTVFRILHQLGIADSAKPPFSIIIKEKYRSLSEIDLAIQTYINNHCA